MHFCADTAERSFDMSNFFENIKKKLNTPKGKEIVDKITTGLLIAMLCSPVVVLTYILLWFVLR